MSSDVEVVARAVQVNYNAPAEIMARAAIAALDAHRATVPHVVTTARGLSDLPEGTVLRDRDGWLYEVGEDRWFLLGGDPYNKCSQPLVMLPATVLTPTPEPTVKPDREAEFKTYLSCIEEEEPEIQRLAKYDKHTLRTIFNAGFDVAVAEGRTEREVAEAAWDEGRQSLALDMGNPLREDMTRESTANPYRAKGATETTEVVCYCGRTDCPIGTCDR